MPERVPAHDRQHGQAEDYQTQGRRGARGGGQVDGGQDPGLGLPHQQYHTEPLYCTVTYYALPFIFQRVFNML